MGFRQDGNKSSGMAARTPWRAAATAAAGEVTERSDLGVRQPVLLWFGNISRVWGTVLVVIDKWSFRRNG